MTITELSIAAITVPKTTRQLSQPEIDRLKESILCVGLINPITVRSDGILIAGRRRLAAIIQMGATTITANVIELSDMKAELASLDENLCRGELTALDAAKAIARRKAVYETLHPEAKAGVAGARASNRKQGKGNATDKMSTASFASDTAEKTGKTERQIRRDVAIGRDLDDEAAAIIADHPVADNKSELKKLAALPAEDQILVAKCIADGDAESVTDALRADDDAGDEIPTEKDRLSRFESAIRTCWQEILDEGPDLAPAIVAAYLEAIAEKIRKE